MSTRLPIFTEITKNFQEATRNLLLSNVDPLKSSDELLAFVKTFGALHVFDTKSLWLGEVKLSYFDIRSAASAHFHLSGFYSLEFIEDPFQPEFVDSVTIETDSPSMITNLFKESLYKFRYEESLLELRLYDRRETWKVRAWLLKHGCALKNSVRANEKESPVEYVKLTKTRRRENRAEYVIDLEKIQDVGRTTLMIKNIPNKYTQKMLVAEINRNHKGTYDFLYLPIDFKNKCNVGYAFINFIDFRSISKFYAEFDGKQWRKFNSEKICALSYARIQGIKALISHFRCSSILSQEEEMRPLILKGKRL